MGNSLVNPNVIPLLQGLKPYLGNNGQVLTDGVLSLVQLMTSQHGQEAIHTMSKVIAGPNKSDKIMTVNTVGGSVTVSLNLAFTLFLILILLILSGNLLALDFTGGCVDPVETGQEEHAEPVPEGTLV